MVYVNNKKDNEYFLKNYIIILMEYVNVQTFIYWHHSHRINK